VFSNGRYHNESRSIARSTVFGSVIRLGALPKLGHLF
jgi:hypothetical protein